MDVTIQGLHHVKLPVADLPTSRAFYECVFDLTPALEFPDPAGVVRGVVYRPIGGVTLALREDPARAAALAGYDLVAFAVDVAKLPDWVARLDGLGIAHSGPVQGAMGTVVGLDDPDGMKVVLYGEDVTSQR